MSIDLCQKVAQSLSVYYILQVLSLFLEEVPSVTLNLLLAQCREVPVSYYQLAKAGFQMLGSGFR